MRRTGRLAGLGSGVLLVLCLATAAAPADEVAITGVDLFARDSTLVCMVRTTGLPDGPSRETLASGLPSALVFSFSLLDASHRQLLGSLAQVRVEPDLWENTFLVRMPLRDQRVPSLGDVDRELDSVGPFPIAPLDLLPASGPFGLQVQLAVHPLAPAEIERARGLFTGETSYDEPNKREVSVGLGSLIRYFMGNPDKDDWIAVFTTTVQRREDLPVLAQPSRPMPQETP